MFSIYEEKNSWKYSGLSEQLRFREFFIEKQKYRLWKIPGKDSGYCSFNLTNF